jgi:hypothetical protein
MNWEKNTFWWFFAGEKTNTFWRKFLDSHENTRVDCSRRFACSVTKLSMNWSDDVFFAVLRPCLRLLQSLSHCWRPTVIEVVAYRLNSLPDALDAAKNCGIANKSTASCSTSHRKNSELRTKAFCFVQPGSENFGIATESTVFCLAA